MRRDRGTLMVVAALALALAGCTSANSVLDSVQGAVADFDPFGTKQKPLPGERKALFPEGVPGVQQGVPPEIMVGNRPTPIDGQAPVVETNAAVAAGKAQRSAPAEQPRPQAKARDISPRPKRQPAPKAAARSAPPPPSASEPREDTVWPPLQRSPAQAAPPPPAQTASPWPSPMPASPPPAQSPWPSTSQSEASASPQASSAPWPAPPVEPSPVWPSPR